MKYRGRKKYSQAEAETMLENTMQLIKVNEECILYWKTCRPSRTDRLIEALCNQSREEMIKQNEDQLEYLYDKFEYMKQFAPDYKLKGSFGIM